MSEQMERNAYQQLLEGITFYIDKVVSDNKEKTMTARVISIQKDGSYTIDLEGKQYSNIGTIGGVCTVNEMVKVMIPQGQYNNMFILKGGSGSGGSSTSGVTSVNGKAGNVVLTASDVGALPNTTVIPTKTSELDNDSGFIADTDYVHTDNNFTTTLKDKLNGIANGAEVNVQANWDETDVNSDAYVKNKPSIPTKTSELQNDSNYVVDKDYIHTDNNYTNADKTSVGTIKDKVDKVEGKGLSTNDLTDALKSQYDEAVVDKHIHANKQILDGITASYTEEEKTKLEGIEDEAQKNTVIGVKGNSETAYRTGNINITKENIGLSNVDNVKQWSNDNHPTTLSDYGITDGIDSTDFSNLEQKVNTNEDNIAMLDSDIEGLNTSVGTLQTDMGSVKTAVKTLQDTYVPNTRKVNGKSLDKDISIDKSDVGLGNVPNVLTDNQTPTFVQNETLENIVSGEKLSVLFGKISKAISDLVSHIADKTNPHGVTKEQIGLNNVPNVTTDDQTPAFTQATTRVNIKSGETLSVLFGKIMKWLTDLKSVAFSGSYNDLIDTPTIPTVDTELSNTSTNPVQNKVINTALDGKLNTDGTAVKSIGDNDGNNILSTYANVLVIATGLLELRAKDGTVLSAVEIPTIGAVWNGFTTMVWQE